MATITSASIDKPTGGQDTFDITVRYTLDLEPDEVGKKFYVAVELWPSDGPLEKQEGVLGALTAKPLHRFTFAGSGLKGTPWHAVTPTATPYEGTVKNNVSRKALDEDLDDRVPDNGFEEQDEIVAHVYVATRRVSKVLTFQF